jgi:hypothetical protein
MRHAFTYFLLLILAAPVQAARYALVMGNADYAAVPDLYNPRADAEDMAAELEKLGFRVTPLIDADKRGMDTALEQFIETLKSTGGGEVVVYYSGHGMQYQGGNYLVPTDARPKTGADIPYLMVNAQRILDNLQEVNADGVNLLILDACRNSPFKSISKSTGQGLASMKPSGSLVLYATSPGTEAQGDGSWRNSIYTHHLLQALRNPALRQGSIFDLLTEVTNAVSRETEKAQVPWQEGALTRRFCFISSCGVASAYNEKLSLREVEVPRNNISCLEIKGAEYDGNCLDGLPHGYGVMSFDDGSRYEGNFESGKQHGYGLYFDNTGRSVIQGFWQNGESPYNQE